MNELNQIDTETNKRLMMYFPSLKGKLWSDKNGKSFVYTDDLVFTMLDRENIKLAVEDYLDKISNDTVKFMKDLGMKNE